MGPNPMCRVSLEEEIRTHTHRGRATRGLGEEAWPSTCHAERPQERPALLTPWSQTLASRTAKRWVNFCYSSRPICGTSLRLPEQTNTQIHTETLSSQQGTERGFPGSPVVKNYLAMQETRVRSLVGEPRSQVWWSNYWACALCATVTIPHAASETRHGQINIKNLKKHWRLYWSILFMNTDDMSIPWVTDVVILCKGFSKIWKSLELLLQGKKTEKGRACSLPLNLIRHHLAQTSLCRSNLLNDVCTQGLLWAPGWALHVWR